MFCAVTAVATYEPMPGSVYDLLSTLIASLAARKNQPPPKLIIAFQTSPMAPAGSSSFTKRSQRESPYAVVASSRSAGTVRSD